MHVSYMKGFTLIELMIVIVIMGIIAAIAFPSYEQYMRKSKRSEGHSVLLEVMRAQERYYTDELTYTSDLKDLGYSKSTAVPSENEYYEISASACVSPYSTDISNCVRLTAKAVGSQTKDGNLVLNSAGLKSPSDRW